MEEKENNVNFEIIREAPNFKFEKYLTNMNDNSIGFNDKFEVFTYNKDNNQYLISPGLKTYLIYIICISDNQLFKSLKGHKECII